MRRSTRYSPSSETIMQICAFCLKPAKMSREHVWSAWVEKLYSSPHQHFSLRALTANKSNRHWKSRSIDLTSKVVCEDCNNTWMSDLEESHAKPAMADMIQHGGSVCLLPSGVNSIAAFAFKTSVVADHNRPRDTPFFSHAARKKFSQSLQIPDGVQIWLASFESEYRLSGRLITYYMQIRGGRFRGFELYALTYVVGHLVVQVTASRWLSLAKRPRHNPQLTQNPLWHQVAVPIWPHNTSIVWPPSEPIRGDDSLEIFAARWSKLAETV